jgi:hypothetical protein
MVHYKLNVVVEWVAILRHIVDIPGLYLGQKTTYLDLVQSHQVNVRIVPKIRPRPLPPAPFPIYHSLIIVSFDAM